MNGPISGYFYNLHKFAYMENIDSVVKLYSFAKSNKNTEENREKLERMICNMQVNIHSSVMKHAFKYSDEIKDSINEKIQSIDLIKRSSLIQDISMVCTGIAEASILSGNAQNFENLLLDKIQEDVRNECLSIMSGNPPTWKSESDTLNALKMMQSYTEQHFQEIYDNFPLITDKIINEENKSVFDYAKEQASEDENESPFLAL